ncbi:glycosyltransferase [Bacillus mycoides]|uniref:glycosyltransferase n=1 Tax=Bacillus mycoides TaxID=1405 RepID=UPI001C020FC9|nr:glycosyltransferase [Bacillus mycoides]QWG47495.1 glycosyltransferase [Bacillus mycoides]
MNNDSINQRLNNIKKRKISLRQDIISEVKLIEIEKEELKLFKQEIPIKEKNTRRIEKTPVSSIQTIEAPKLKVEGKDIEAEYIDHRNRNCDKEYFNRIKYMLEELPESNGSKFYPKAKVNIGIIADEFLYNSFNGIANFIYITPENYREYANKLDVFFIATTWKGLNLEWRGLGNPKSRKRREQLFEIIKIYKEKGVKVVFYSKEDPVNYERFIELAKKCDYIFTTAEEVVKDYKKDCQNENVNVLNFGVNPIYHNPIGIKKFTKQKEVLFAGSWYDKYPHRQEDTRMIFDGILDGEAGLKIIDRNYELNNAQYFFPKEYTKYVSPSVEHGYLQKLHKLYDWAINLNSVKYSETMFANRVYELQALGNILLSNYSTAINNKFPNVFLVHDKNEVQDILNGFTEEEKYKHQMYGVRKVMTSETTFHRLEQLLDTIGYSSQKIQRRVAVVVKDKSEHIQQMFEKQTYPNKDLMLENEFNEHSKKQYDFVAFFSEDKEYREFYLEDMINAFKYTNCDYVTKEAYYEKDILVSGVQHDYVTTMYDKHRTVFWTESYATKDLLRMTGAVELPNGYSIDCFEFNNRSLKEQAKKPKDYKLSVIIPTYNNGDYLLNKCFGSLKRSSMFEDMEIIIVDDGSTDNYTPRIVSRLAEDYCNVSSYFFNDGGSASASRPRNKGFELSTAPYITYLDPDNEAVNDAYRKLYDEINNNDYDFVVGNIFRLSDKAMRLNYYRTVVQHNKQDIVEGKTKELLISSKFKAASIQALVARREVIDNNSLRMVVGAAGQDTLFFHELMLHSDKVKAVNLDVHVYYAAVSGSTVNSISKRFYEKYNALEKRRVEALRRHGILEDYLERRFEYYFKNWYLVKLQKVKKDEALESIKIIAEIFDLYKKDVKLKDPELIRFAKWHENKDYTSIKEEYMVL